MERIRSAYEGDADMMEIVREFAAELPSRIARIEELLGAGDEQELSRLAHQLKGAGGGYGFPQVSESAAALEQAIKSGAADSEVKDRAADLTLTLRSVEVSEDA
jgi:HPt (histidine-containing phosphotransfer) domain-containing protein